MPATRNRTAFIHIVVVVLALLGSTSALAQSSDAKPAAAPADSFSGVWRARSRNPAYNGTLELRLELRQRGDSVAGTVEMAVGERASQAPLDLTGSIQNGRLSLTDRLGAFHLDGTLRSEKLEARVRPSQGGENTAFTATFARNP